MCRIICDFCPPNRGVRHFLHGFYTKQRGSGTFYMDFTYKGHALLLFGFTLDDAQHKKAEIIMISAFSSS